MLSLCLMMDLKVAEIKAYSLMPVSDAEYSSLFSVQVLPFTSVHPWLIVQVSCTFVAFWSHELLPCNGQLITVAIRVSCEGRTPISFIFPFSGKWYLTLRYYMQYLYCCNKYILSYKTNLLNKICERS